MSNETIIQAWKNEEFRKSLSDEEQALLPQNPAGLIELDDSDLEIVAGAAKVKRTFSCTSTNGSSTCNCTCNASRMVNALLTGN